jgi:hypothetical protein
MHANTRTAAQLVLSVAILAFSVFTIAAVAEHGVVGFLEEVTENMATLQVSIDTTILATLALIWIYRDSRGFGIPFAPYLLLTAATPSIGVMGYLLHRTSRRASAA